MATERVPKDQYKVRVAQEQRSLLFQVFFMIALSLGIALAFFLTLNGAET